MTVTEIRPRSAEQVTREAAQQLGFAWHCVKSSTEGQCDEAGNDRAEYAAHMRGHGAKAIRGTRSIKLKRRPPAATLGKLDVLPLKWLHWEETHSEPLPCTCGHGHDEHGPQWVKPEHPVRRFGRHTRGTYSAAGCTECPCLASRYELPRDVQTATRRGQFWSAGSMPHTYWVLPFQPGPWEDGRAQPVELHVSSFIR